MTMNSNRTALVLGATGGIGGEMARQLRDAGWQVRALKRKLGTPSLLREGIEWVDGDAMQASELARAARGCSVIVHAVNPPGYRNWAELVLPMIDNSIAAARETGATIVLPGTVYNYGPDVFPLIYDDSPQHARTRKGVIRVAMERRLQAAATAGEVRVIIVRAGDYFGPEARNNWFSQAMVKPGHPVSVINLPGKTGVGHQFAYLPDVARTMLQLLEIRERLPAFARYNMAGHWDADGRQMGRAVQDVVVRHGGPKPRLQAFAWWQIWLGAPFLTTLREMLEMRYLWQHELRLDNSGLLAVLSTEPHTPLESAIEATLTGMACLEPG